MQKLLWFEINKKEVEELTGDIYNNQDNKDFKIIINKRTYDLINTKNFWMGVTTRKITRREAKKLYSKLIQKDTDALEREKSNDTRKYNILNILNNVGSIFTTDTDSHYKDVPKETMLERFHSIQLWFTDQNNRPFGIEDSANITLIIGQTL